MDGRGLYYPKLPKMLEQDIGILQRDGKRKKSKPFFEKELEFDNDIDDYVQRSMKKYTGMKYQLNGGKIVTVE
jgi:hypothetical protein